jgi:hypothetical protein
VLAIVLGAHHKLKSSGTVVGDQRPPGASHLQLLQQSEEIAPAERHFTDGVVGVEMKS